MGILGKLIKTGLAAGAAYAAVKVNEKYKEQNPNGVADPQEKLEAIKQAAGEVYQNFSEVAKEKAPGIVNGVNTAAQQAVNIAKEKAPDLVGKVQSAAETVSEKAQEFADTLSTEPVDADFEPVEKDEEEK